MRFPDTHLTALICTDSLYWQQLVDHLNFIFSRLAFIKINTLTNSYLLSIYHDKKIVEQLYMPNPQPIRMFHLDLFSKILKYYAIMPLYSVVLALIASKRIGSAFDVVIAHHWHAIFSGLLLRKLRKAKRVVYWCAEWHPQSRHGLRGIETSRFITFHLSTLLDRYYVEHCDATWDLHERISMERKARWRGANLPETLTVYPLTVQRTNERNFVTNEMTYVGRSLYKGVVVELGIEALAILKEKGIDFRMEIISGATRLDKEHERLLEYAQSKAVSDRVAVHAYLPDEDVFAVLSRSFCGLAIFYGEKHLSNYTIPAKVVLYLEHGVPVIVSKHSCLASLLERTSAGIAIDYEANQLADAMVKLWADWHGERRYTKNALRLIRDYFTDTHFAKALNALLRGD